MKKFTLTAAALMLSLSAGAAYANHHKGHDKGPMTKAEYMAKAEKRFNMMDANKDGTVTHDERKAAMKKMHEKWGKDKKQRKGGDYKRDKSRNDTRSESNVSPQGERKVDGSRVLKR